MGASTIQEALQILRDSKINIRQSITDKGGTITGDDGVSSPFQNYGNAITDLSGTIYDPGTITFDKETTTAIPNDFKDYWSKETSMNGKFSGYTKLTTVGDLNLNSATNVYQLLYNTSSLVSVGTIYAPLATHINNIIYSSTAQNIGGIIAPLATQGLYFVHQPTTLGTIQIDSITDINGWCNSLSNLTSIDKFYAPNATNCNNAFSGATKLTRIGEIEIAGNMGTSSFFKNCTSLTYCKFNNLGKLDTSSGRYVGYNFEGATKWGTGSEENRQSVVDSLLTNSFDRAAAGYTLDCSFSLSETTLGLLTDEEKEAIVNKGYTLTT